MEVYDLLCRAHDYSETCHIACDKRCIRPAPLVIRMEIFMIHLSLLVDRPKKSYIALEKSYFQSALLMSRGEKQMIHAALPTSRHEKYYIALEK